MVSQYQLVTSCWLSALLIGCVEPPQDSFLVEFTTDTLLVHDLDGELFVDGDSLERPTDIVVGERFLFIGDPDRSQAIAIFDRESGGFVANTATKGEGAQELSRLKAMNFKPGSKSGWIYDPPATAKFFDGISITGEVIRLTGGGFPMDPVWIAGDSIVSSGIYESGRFGLYNPTGSFVRSIGQIPPGETPLSVRQYAYEAILRTNSLGTRIVAASLNTDRIEIFDNSKILHLIRGPGFHEPEFSVFDFNGEPRTFIEDETIQGYVSVTVTDQFIFALYSGRTRGWVRSQGYFSPPGQIVIIFTWRGEPIGVLGLADGAMQIGISQDGRYMYAIHRSPIPMVLRYNVPVLYHTVLSG